MQTLNNFRNHHFNFIGIKELIYAKSFYNDEYVFLFCGDFRFYQFRLYENAREYRSGHKQINSPEKMAT